MRHTRALRIGLAALLLAGVLPAAIAAGGTTSSPVAESLQSLLVDELGFDPDQAPRWGDALVEVGDQWLVFDQGGDASVPPATPVEDVPWVVPLQIGMHAVQWQDPDRVPDLDDFAIVGGVLRGAAEGGPRSGPTYVVMTAVMADDFPLDAPLDPQHFDFVLQIPGLETWQALPQFPDDTWNGGSLVLSLRHDGGEWVLRFFTFSNGSIVERDFPGFGFISGNALVLGVEADPSIFAPELFQGSPPGPSAATRRGAATGTGFGSDLDITGRVAFDIPGLVMASPGTRDAFFGYLGNPFPLIPGLPGLFDVPDFVLFSGPDGDLWIKMFPYQPWDPTPPGIYYSNYIQWALRPDGSEQPHGYGGFQTHDGVSETFSGSGSELGSPIEGYIMNDGALLFRTGIPYEGGAIEAVMQGGFQAVDGGQFLFARRTSTVTDDDIGSSEDPTRFDDEYPVYDLTTGTPVDPPASTVTTTTAAPSTVTTTSTPATTVTTRPATTTDRPSTITRSVETCWWCWGLIALFAIFLITMLYLWLKTYEWWTCWIPWFIVIFIWAPFLLAGLWFWGPAWWWWPLLAWFPLIGGYTWWWARHRSWWRPWMLYVVGGYLAALVAGMVVVGSPTWGLLLPLFWLPPVAFYLWYRAPRQPWWRPWFYGLFVGYVAWMFIWVIWLTPWWAWWYPVAFVPFLGWWFVSHRYTWQVVHGPKWCWVIPFASIPFLAWWIPWWGPWWCFIILGFFGLSLFCTIFNHFKEQEWWSCWIPWFLLIFFGVPFLLAGLFFFAPVWWWGPLLAWFPLVGGYTWWWARRRSWWQPWMLYVVGGYLAALVIGMVVVGSPRWWLLFPFFWLPPIGFYLWYRARRQQWWRPWMYLPLLGWVGGVLLWVGVSSPSPWWAGWFPTLFLGGLGWWFVDHGYEWDLMARKASWIVPCGLLPWIGFMLAVDCIPEYYL